LKSWFLLSGRNDKQLLAKKTAAITYCETSLRDIRLVLHITFVATVVAVYIRAVYDMSLTQSARIVLSQHKHQTLSR